MEIILLESFDKLGKIGDIVNVKDGFARNYLLPQKKALRANKENKDYYEKIKKNLEDKNKELIDNAEKLAGSLLNKEVIFIRQASDTGQLYGSVSPKDISNHMKSDDIDIPPSNINLTSAIKKIGIYDVKIKLHAEVSLSIILNVAVSNEQAKEQKEKSKIEEKRQGSKNKIATMTDSQSSADEKIDTEDPTANQKNITNSEESKKKGLKSKEKKIDKNAPTSEI